MRTRNSDCQIRCRMQGICVVGGLGGCSNTGYVGYSIPLHITKKRADLFEAKAGEPSRISSISGSPLL